MKLAIVGVTGVVGETLLRVLAERAIAVDELGAFASRDRDETIAFDGRAWPIRRATPDSLRGYDAVLFASSGDGGAALVEACVAGGALAIDNSPTFRERADVPLVVPEINAAAIRPEQRIFPVANCTAIVVTMGLAPIAGAAGLRSVRVASYQAVSGAGRDGLDELTAGEHALASGSAEPLPSTFAAPIARNVVPQIGAFDVAGDSGEERKLAGETRKILGLPHLHVAATTVRVPVRTAHAAVVFVETERATSAAELGDAFAGRAGVVFHRAGIVTPRDVEGTDEVHVARLRAEPGDDGRHFQFWVVGDQLRKGAATNAVQILELLIARGHVGGRLPTGAGIRAMKTIVQKFGGSSLATAELREIAASRVLEARARGVAPVVVCSALGRAPDPYATDSLLALLGPTRGGPNRDLLLACGESIACAVFAELLTSWGARAQAMTGAQAGIRTDERFGDARIVAVDPANLIAAIGHGVIPVVAGFQGASERGATTTLGRGGSDLTAIALGQALGSDAVEIFTDVSGVMTGDPRRIVGAHTIERVAYEEMVELAGEGAKVVHGKAAELAHRTNTPYAVKGLHSNVGTTVDDGAPRDALRPVTGITALHDVAFVRVIQGDIDDPEARRALEVAIFARLAERDVSVDMININNAGVFFIVDSVNLELVRSELLGLNLAMRARPHCAKLSIVGSGMRGTPGVMYRVVHGVVQVGIEIIHSTDSNITISLLVAEDDAIRAEQALHDYFKLGRSSADETATEAIA